MRPTATRRPPPSLGAAELPASAGTGPPSTASRRPAGAGCGGREVAAMAGGVTRADPAAGQSGRAAASGLLDPESSGGGRGSDPAAAAD